MDLPIRILDRAPREPVISVDGAFDAPGLNLSHWPGNHTPAELRHDLSTGSALLFAELPPARRAELAQGCTAIVNNHFDTDGVCALFSVRYPDQARARRDVLLEAAACGDFFQLPSERAFVIDSIVNGWVDAERSPWRSDFAGLEHLERYDLAAQRALPIFHEVLDERFDPWSELWKAPLDAMRSDSADLAQASKDELVHLDFTVWSAPAGHASTREFRPSKCFDPGRRVLFGSSDCDRQLVIGPSAAGTTFRFVIGTYSWFDLLTRECQPRPDLAELAARLNEAEGCRAGDAVAWRHQDPSGASPELWFGREPFETFKEHAGDALVASALDPLAVKNVIVDSLRACWAFPE